MAYSPMQGLGKVYIKAALVWFAAPFWALQGIGEPAKDYPQLITEARRQSPDLRSFINDSEAKKRVQILLQEFMGKDRMSDESFNAIINELHRLYPKMGESLERKIWQPKPKGSTYQLTIEARSLGVEINPDRWGAFLANSINRLDNTMAALEDEPTPESDSVARALREVSANLVAAQEHVKSIAGIAAQRAARKEMMAIVFSDARLPAIRAMLLKKAIQSQDIDSKLKYGDADLVLESWDLLRANRDALIAQLPVDLREIGEKTLFGFEHDLPAASKLIADVQMFPPITRELDGGKREPVGRTESQTLEFNPVDPFLSLFKGPPHQICVGGGRDSSGNISAPSAEFVLTGGLEGAQIHMARNCNSGRYAGFIEASPIRHIGTSEVYGSMGFFIPLFARFTYLGPDRHKVPVFELWIRNAEKFLPAQWSGYAVSDSRDFRNAGVIPAVHGSASYINGTTIGDSKDFELLDKRFGEELVTHANNRDQARNYAGRTIIDAMVPTAGALTKLDLSQSPDEVRSAEGLRKILSWGSDESVKKLLLAMGENGNWKRVGDLKRLRAREIAERIFSVIQPPRTVLDGHAYPQYELKRHKAMENYDIEINRTAFAAIGEIYRGSSTAVSGAVLQQLSEFQRLGRYAHDATSALLAIRSEQPDYPAYLWNEILSKGSEAVIERGALVEQIRNRRDSAGIEGVLSKLRALSSQNGTNLNREALRVLFLSGDESHQAMQYASQVLEKKIALPWTGSSEVLREVVQRAELALEFQRRGSLDARILEVLIKDMEWLKDFRSADQTAFETSLRIIQAAQLDDMGIAMRLVRALPDAANREIRLQQLARRTLVDIVNRAMQRGTAGTALVLYEHLNDLSLYSNFGLVPETLLHQYLATHPEQPDSVAVIAKLERLDSDDLPLGCRELYRHYVVKPLR